VTAVQPSDQPPPWQVFPQLQPHELGATQGQQEAWLDSVWRPFWQALNDAERESYLNFWRATKDWREWIRFVCERPTGFDAAQDAAEAQEIRAALLRNTPPRHSFLERLRGAFRRR
jgi:hypothetical protein